MKCAKCKQMSEQRNMIESWCLTCFYQFCCLYYLQNPGLASWEAIHLCPARDQFYKNLKAGGKM